MYRYSLAVLAECVKKGIRPVKKTIATRYRIIVK